MSGTIQVDAVGKRYRLGSHGSAYVTLRETLANRFARAADARETWALRDVSFEVATGEAVGVIGANGAGKSTLLRILSRITQPTTGVSRTRGRVGSLLEVGTGFHPELTGRENVYLNGAILGMRRRDITRRFDEIIEFSGVERFLDTPLKRYSSGMYLRLAFAVAAHLEPEILLVDEVLAVGDAEFQQRCLGRMEDLSGSGRTVLFVSHNMHAINQLCDRAILLERGSIAMDGAPSDVITRYMHSAHGSAAHQEWHDVSSAPGDDLVRLRSVRVVDEDGDAIETADVRRSVGIEIGFRVLTEGRPVFPKIKLRDRQGDIAFNALDTSSHWNDPSPPGDYTATAWIPPNLLNEGTTTVDVAVCSLHAPKLYQHAAAYDAVAFHVYDPGDGDSARGRFTGDLRGVVRPLLDWTAERA